MNNADIMPAITKANNRVQRFINEQVYNAVEYLEGKTPTRDDLETHGVIKYYDDHTQEFYWKGKLAVVIPSPTVDNLMMINLEAFHVYSNTVEKFDG